MQRSRSQTIYILKVLLLLLFIGHYSNSTLFYHVHQINGKTYSHSHFFGFGKESKGVPVTSHNHTSNEFALIQVLNQINITDDLDAPQIPLPQLRYILLPSANSVDTGLLLAHTFFQLRAPPAC